MDDAFEDDAEQDVYSRCLRNTVPGTAAGGEGLISSALCGEFIAEKGQKRKCEVEEEDHMPACQSCFDQLTSELEPS